MRIMPESFDKIQEIIRPYSDILSTDGDGLTATLKKGLSYSSLSTLLYKINASGFECILDKETLIKIRLVPPEIRIEFSENIEEALKAAQEKQIKNVDRPRRRLKRVVGKLSKLYPNELILETIEEYISRSKEFAKYLEPFDSFDFMSEDRLIAFIENKKWHELGARKPSYETLVRLLEDSERRLLFEALVGFLGGHVECCYKTDSSLIKKLAPIMGIKESSVYDYFAIRPSRKRLQNPPYETAAKILAFLMEKKYSLISDPKTNAIADSLLATIKSRLKDYLELFPENELGWPNLPNR
jgi:hypothetical protein